MSILNEIFSCYVESNKENKMVSESLHSFEELASISVSNSDKLIELEKSVLIFGAATEEQGFTSGFKFAMKLIYECIC